MNILQYFPEITHQQAKQYAALSAIYAEWNSHINVISRRDIENLYEHHVLHSLSIAKVIRFEAKTAILDVGTGGGFPGIPLAILFPDTHFHLIDSIGKKLKVVDAITATLQLQNVTTQHIRAEQLKNQYDFAISRAVSSLNEFLPWMKNKITPKHRHALPNGMLFLKGGNLQTEIYPYRNRATVYPISNFFSEPFFAEKAVVYIAANEQQFTSR